MLCVHCALEETGSEWRGRTKSAAASSIFVAKCKMCYLNGASEQINKDKNPKVSINILRQSHGSQFLILPLFIPQRRSRGLIFVEVLVVRFQLYIVCVGVRACVWHSLSLLFTLKVTPSIPTDGSEFSDILWENSSVSDVFAADRQTEAKTEQMGMLNENKISSVFIIVKRRESQPNWGADHFCWRDKKEIRGKRMYKSWDHLRLF